MPLSTFHISILLFSLLLLGTSFPADLTEITEVEKARVVVGYTSESDLSLLWDADAEIVLNLSSLRAVACYLPATSIDVLRTNPRIRYVEPDDFSLRAFGETRPWGIYRVRAPCGWDNDGNLTVDPDTKASTGAGSCVAVLDTGIDYTHPDLAGKVTFGRSFVSYTTDYADDSVSGHGTHVAGTIAAVDNDIGVIGVAPYSALWAIKVLWSSGSGLVSEFAEGLTWVANQGASIACMSLGTDIDQTVLRDACEYAYNCGMLLIAAAGYDNSSIKYPAKYPWVVAVGATSQNCNRYEYSPSGPELEFVAPGVNISSTLPNGTYGNKDGTSMACAHAAGVAALVFSSPIDPNYSEDEYWDNYEVREKLRQMALDLGSSGKDEEYGYGLVNAWATNQRPLGDINIDWVVDIRDLAFVSGYYGTWWDPPNPQNYSWAIADITIDNRVDIRDLAIVSGNYGKHYP
jgi:subtilisin